MKFACTGENRAPPIASPLHPAASSSRRTTRLPDWRRRSRTCAHPAAAWRDDGDGSSARVALIALGSPGRSRNATMATTSNGRIALDRYPNSSSSRPTRRRPSAEQMTAHSRTSLSSPAVGARVHRDRSAHGAGDARPELQSGQPDAARRGAPRAGSERSPTAPQVLAADGDALEASAQANHESTKPRVVDQQVGALAHDRHGHAGITCPRQSAAVTARADPVSASQSALPPTRIVVKRASGALGTRSGCVELVCVTSITQTSLEPGNQLLPRARHVARADRQHQVAGTKLGRDDVTGVVEVGDEPCIGRGRHRPRRRHVR